jgi:hypothetical protein
MIVDGRGGAEVRFRESHEDRRPVELSQHIANLQGVEIRRSARR